jgi:hypothetical protein
VQQEDHPAAFAARIQKRMAPTFVGAIPTAYWPKGQ